MTGRIERKTQELLADLVMGISSNDLEMVIDVVLALGQVDPRMCENRAFRSDISEFISRFQTGTLESMDIAAMLQDFFDLLREYNIQCPADLVFLIKALTTIEGVGEALDPDFNLIATMRPYIEKLVRDRYGPKKLFSLVRRMALSYTDTLDHLPRDWHTLMYMIKNNELRVNLDHSGADKFINEISFASRNVAAALIIAALLVGSSILVLADRNQTYGIMYIVGALGVFTAAISTMTLIVFNFWHRRR